MTLLELSRRSLLGGIASSLGAVVLPLGWQDLERAMVQAQENQAAPPATLSVLSVTDAADVDAVTALIIPSVDTPGAREAHIAYFIDRALDSFLSQLAADYREQLEDFQRTFHESHPDADAFASLATDQQIDYLKTVDRTPFFETTRLPTIPGTFSKPSYGGNREAIGWKLLGFEEQGPRLSADAFDHDESKLIAV